MGFPYGRAVIVLTDGLDDVAETLLGQVKTRDEPHQDNTTIVILGCEQQETPQTTRSIDQTKQRRPLLPVIATTSIIVVLGIALWFSGLLPPLSLQSTRPAAPALSPTAIREQSRITKEADATQVPAEQADEPPPPNAIKPEKGPALAAAAAAADPSAEPADNQQVKSLSFVHPTKSYLVSWRPLIFSLRNSLSRKP